MLRLTAIRFVLERQKVTRKLNKMKRELESCTDKKERKKIEEALFELRVDLNYIIVRCSSYRRSGHPLTALTPLALPKTDEIHLTPPA